MKKPIVINTRYYEMYKWFQDCNIIDQKKNYVNYVY